MTDDLIVADRALSKVGTTLEELRRHGGSLLTSGPAYLVGSLAQGFGNRGSDVDVHVFTPEVPRPAPPYLFFVDALTVDVEHYPESYAEQVTSRLPAESVVTKLGRLTPEVTLGHEDTGRLTRWCTAVPLDAGTPAILSAESRRTALAYLLRVALGAVLAAWGTAEVVARSGRDAGHLWRVCGRSLLSLAAAAAGFPPIGRKWLPARVARAGVPAEFVRSAMTMTDGRDMAELMAGLGLDALDPLALSRLEPGTGTADVPVGRQRFHLTPLGVLEPGPRPAGGPCAEVLAATGPEGAAALLGAGLLRLVVDERAVAAALREVAG